MFKSAFLLTALLIVSEASNADPLELQGLWQKSCELNSAGGSVLVGLTILGDDWKWEISDFQSATCEVGQLSYLVSKKAIFSENGNIDLTLIDTQYLPKTSQVAAKLNAISFCGLSNWVEGISQSVVGLICNQRPEPRQGEVLYSIFREGVSPNSKPIFFLGEKDSINDGSAPDRRHQGYQMTPYEKIK